jgi:AraC-like DNA-binding protein
MAVQVRAAALTNFAEVAGSLGHDAAAALRRVGLKPGVLRQPDQRIPASAVVQLLEQAAAATGCDNFGLRMAQSRQLSDLGVVSLLLTHQPTLRAVLVTLIAYLHLVNESLAMQIEDAGRLVIVREDIVSSGPARQSVELAIGVLYRMCAALFGERWRPVSVHFAHGAPADAGLHRQLFRCRLAFDAGFSGFACAAADLDVPNPGADPGLARYAQGLVEAQSAGRGSVQQQVRKAIYLMLPAGRATCEAVAQGLGVSLRTLQRQLDAEGATFVSLLHEVRRDLARQYVANARYSVGQVAAMLGYSTHSAFTRWFVGQFGCAPEVWRRQPATLA